MKNKENGKTVREIIDELEVSKTFVYDMIALEKKTNAVLQKKQTPTKTCT